MAVSRFDTPTQSNLIDTHVSNRVMPLDTTQLWQAGAIDEQRAEKAEKARQDNLALISELSASVRDNDQVRDLLAQELQPVNEEMSELAANYSRDRDHMAIRKATADLSTRLRTNKNILGLIRDREIEKSRTKMREDLESKGIGRKFFDPSKVSGVNVSEDGTLEYSTDYQDVGVGMEKFLDPEYRTFYDDIKSRVTQKYPNITPGQIGDYLVAYTSKETRKSMDPGVKAMIEEITSNPNYLLSMPGINQEYRQYQSEEAGFLDKEEALARVIRNAQSQGTEFLGEDVIQEQKMQVIGMTPEGKARGSGKTEDRPFAQYTKTILNPDASNDSNSQMLYGKGVAGGQTWNVQEGTIARTNLGSNLTTADYEVNQEYRKYLDSFKDVRINEFWGSVDNKKGENRNKFIQTAAQGLGVLNTQAQITDPNNPDATYEGITVTSPDGTVSTYGPDQMQDAIDRAYKVMEDNYSMEQYKNAKENYDPDFEKNFDAAGAPPTFKDWSATLDKSQHAGLKNNRIVNTVNPDGTVSSTRLESTVLEKKLKAMGLVAQESGAVFDRNINNIKDWDIEFEGAETSEGKWLLEAIKNKELIEQGLIDIGIDKDGDPIIKYKATLERPMDIKQDIANVPKYEKNFTTPGKVGMVTEHSVDEIKANYYLYDLGETQKMVTDFNRVAAGIASENNGHTVTADDMNEVLTQQGYNPLKPEVWNAMKRAEELKAKGQTPGKSLTNKERKEIQEKLKYVRNNL